jgi:hypothetical protein
LVSTTWQLAVAAEAAGARAIPADPAITPATASVISAGLAVRDFSRAFLACWVWASGSFSLIGFLPVTFQPLEACHVLS